MADGVEPRHIHVARDRADAKFWLDPDVALAHNRGFAGSELKRIEVIVRGNLQALRDAWNDIFNP